MNKLEEIYFDRRGQAKVRNIEFQVSKHAYDVYMQHREAGKSIKESYSYTKIYALTKFYDVTKKVAYNNGFSAEERISFLMDCLERFHSVFGSSPQHFENVRKSKIGSRKTKHC